MDVSYLTTNKGDPKGKSKDPDQLLQLRDPCKKELAKEFQQKDNHNEAWDRNNRTRTSPRRSASSVDEKDTCQPSAEQDECATIATSQDIP